MRSVDIHRESIIYTCFGTLAGVEAGAQWYRCSSGEKDRQRVIPQLVVLVYM